MLSKPMTQQLEIAERLAQLRRELAARERRDITQAMIAEAVGLVPETYSRYEKGRRKVPEEAIAALAAYFGVTRSFLRYGDESQEAPKQGTLTPEDVEAARARVAARKKKDSPPIEAVAGGRPRPKRRLKPR